MTKEEIKALTNAFKALDKVNCLRPSHEEMSKMMAPIFDELVKARVPEELVIALDQVLSTHYSYDVVQVAVVNIPDGIIIFGPFDDGEAI